MRPPPAGRVGVRHLPAETASVRAARRYAADLTRAWGLDDLADTAELLVGELAANAVAASRPPDVQATPGPAAPPRIALRLTRTDTAVLVEVWDADATTTPVRRAHDIDAEDGRGLLLVEALSHDLGFYLPVGGGKVVWCALPIPGTQVPRADGPAGTPFPPPRREVGAVAFPDPGLGRPVNIGVDQPLPHRVADGLRASHGWHLPGAVGHRACGPH